MEYTVIENYCFLEGKWFHMIRHNKTKQFIMTSSKKMILKYKK
jgi:hypothetical protein